MTKIYYDVGDLKEDLGSADVVRFYDHVKEMFIQQGKPDWNLQEPYLWEFSLHKKSGNVMFSFTLESHKDTIYEIKMHNNKYSYSVDRTEENWLSPFLGNNFQNYRDPTEEELTMCELSYPLFYKDYSVWLDEYRKLNQFDIAVTRFKKELNKLVPNFGYYLLRFLKYATNKLANINKYLERKYK